MDGKRASFLLELLICGIPVEGYFMKRLFVLLMAVEGFVFLSEPKAMAGVHIGIGLEIEDKILLPVAACFSGEGLLI